MGCESKRDCKSLIAVSRSGQNYEFEMMALMSKYVAVGFSQDNKMVRFVLVLPVTCSTNKL